jgi:hypothetical protein
MNINRSGNRLEFSLDDKERQRVQKSIGKALQVKTLEVRLEDALTRLAATEQRLELAEKRFQGFAELEEALKGRGVI